MSTADGPDQLPSRTLRMSQALPPATHYLFTGRFTFIKDTSRGNALISAMIDALKTVENSPFRCKFSGLEGKGEPDTWRQIIVEELRLSRDSR